MKTLLATVVIILIFLVIIAYILNQYTIKKIVIKEQFATSGDVYSLQSGEAQFEIITKLETDVNHIGVKQEQNSKDFINFKDDSTNQFSTLSTGLNQFKTDTGGKLATLQETTNKQGLLINNLDKNLSDVTNNFKSINNSIAVIDGKIISITGNQQKQIDSLQNNYTSISDQQSKFGPLIDSKTADIYNKINGELSSTKNDLNKNIAAQTSIIGNTNNQIGVLTNDYNSFKKDTYKLDGDQQSSINNLVQKASTLNDSIQVAQNRINDVAATFKDYIKQDQLGNFVVKTDLLPYATTNQLGNYAPKTVLAEFISANQLNTYVRKVELQPTIDALKNTNDNIKSFVTNDTLKPTVDSLNNAKSALDKLTIAVNTISSNYVTKTDLPKLAMDASGSAVLKTALDGMQTSVTTLSTTIADIKGSLTNYVLKTDWNAINKTFVSTSIYDPYVAETNSKISAINDNISKNFATKNELNAYAKLSQMTQWPTKDDLDAVTTNFNAQIANIKGGTSQILGTLQVNSTLKVDQIKASKWAWDKQMPSGWGGGVHTWDLYAGSTIAAGQGGNIGSYINSGGDAKFDNRLGVGIDPANMGGQKFRVNSSTPDWQTLFSNPNGGRNIFLNHGDGYGIHINTNDQRDNRYAMQLHNGKQEVMSVMNNGKINIANQLCVGNKCVNQDSFISKDDINALITNFNKQIAEVKANVAQNNVGIDGSWRSPNGWNMTIKGTAGGNNGQLDWYNNGQYQYEAKYNSDGTWILTTHGNAPFRIISDGRLAAVNNNWGNGDDVKFTKGSSGSSGIDGKWCATNHERTGWCMEIRNTNGPKSGEIAWGRGATEFKYKANYLGNNKWDISTIGSGTWYLKNTNQLVNSDPTQLGKTYAYVGGAFDFNRI
jgi:predicted  nucleic acid-binding Zn-ribbon protein